MLENPNDDEYELLQWERLQPDRHLGIQCQPILNASLYAEVQALKSVDTAVTDVKEWVPFIVANMAENVTTTGRPKLIDWKEHQLQNGYMLPNAKLEAQLAEAAKDYGPIQGDAADKGKEVASEDSNLRGSTNDGDDDRGENDDEIPAEINHSAPSSAAQMPAPTYPPTIPQSVPTPQLSTVLPQNLIGTIHEHPLRYTARPYGRTLAPTVQEKGLDRHYRGNTPKPLGNGKTVKGAKWARSFAAAKVLLRETGYTPNEILVACESGRTRDVALLLLELEGFIPSGFQDTDP
jgi:hypothetical protein